MEPILISSLDISRAGKNCKILLGDIDGDGRMELVCAQPDGGIDDRYVPHMVVCLTAFSLTGELLWQAGEPVAQPGGPGSDYPVQIADIDGDGRLEVLAVMDKTLFVLDGADEKEQKRQEQEQWKKMSLEEHMDVYMEQGMAKKEAMKAVAKDRGVSKRDIYAQLLK